MGEIIARNMEPVPPHPGHQQAASSMHYTTSCKHSLVLLRMGEIIARNMEPVPPHPSHQQAASSVHYTTSCKHSLVLLRMGEIIAQNMLSWLKLLIILLLLHLVGCLYYLSRVWNFHGCGDKFVLLWIVRLCSLVGVRRRFGDKYLNYIIVYSVYCECEFVN